MGFHGKHMTTDSGGAQSVGLMSALEWIGAPDGNGATESFDANQRIFSFVPGELGGQAVVANFRVPLGYLAGRPIVVTVPSFSDSTSNAFLLRAVATLIKEGSAAVDSTTDQRTTTNLSITNTAPAKVLRKIVLDITDEFGLINNVSVAPGDLILIKLSRSTTDTDTSEIKILPDSTEVNFS